MASKSVVNGVKLIIQPSRSALCNKRFVVLPYITIYIINMLFWFIVQKYHSFVLFRLLPYYVSD